MSTYWGYVCESHDPPLESERWFNHGADMLTEVFLQERAGEWPNDPEMLHWEEPVPVVHRGHATTAPIEWLRQHPRCAIALRNEYGDRRPIGETVPGSIVHPIAVARRDTNEPAEAP
jgi:hypothetical protein